MTDPDIAAVQEALVDIPMVVEAGNEWIIDGHAALARVEARLEAAKKAAEALHRIVEVGMPTDEVRDLLARVAALNPEQQTEEER